MQSIVRKAVRPFTVVLKGIILVLIICAAGGAWAVTKPLAVWNGDFDVTSRGGFTLDLNGNTLANSLITIGSSSSGGVCVSDANSSGYHNIIVIAGFKSNGNSAGGKRMFSAWEKRGSDPDAKDLVGLGVDSSDSKFKALWNDGFDAGNVDNATYPTDGDVHYISFVHATKVSSTGGVGYLDGSKQVMSRPGLANSRNPNDILGVNIGGKYSGATMNFSGATINYIAMYAGTGNTVASDYTSVVEKYSPTEMTSASSPATETILSATENDTLATQGINLPINGYITISGDVTVAAVFAQGNSEIRFADENSSLTVSGPVYVAGSNRLTITPAALTTTDTAKTLISASVIGSDSNVSVTVPEESGYRYVSSVGDTAVTLIRYKDIGLDYTATPDGGFYAGSAWFTDFGGYSTPEAYRVGPSTTYPAVSEVKTPEFNPYKNYTAALPFSFAIYADLSEMAENTIIMEFGTQNNGIIMYKNGDDGGNVRVGRATNGNISGLVQVARPNSGKGYHLYTVTCAADGSLNLYVDDGTVKGSGTIATDALAAGFQIGSIYGGGTISWLSAGNKMAVAKILGWNGVLSAEDVAALAQEYPATTGTIDRTILWNNSGNTLKVYSSEEDSTACNIDVDAGAVTIVSGEEVSVSKLRTQPSGILGEIGASSVTVAGTLNINGSDSTIGSKAEDASICLGYWVRQNQSGARTTDLTVASGGVLNAPNAYVQIPWATHCQGAEFNISGTAKIKGLYSNQSGKGTVTLANGGVLEVAEILSSGQAITKNFRYGTFRIAADAEETRAINFSAVSSYATTLDPNGHTLTMAAAAMTGSAAVTIGGSNGGKVVFKGWTSSFTGTLQLTDANSHMIEVQSWTDFVGNITGTLTIDDTNKDSLSLATFPWDRFSGNINYAVTGGTLDLRGYDKSSNTINVTGSGATVLLTAGQEGTLNVSSGATAELYTDADTYYYLGHVYGSGMVEGTLVYKFTADSGMTYSAVAADAYNGNNLLPYYYVWTPSETASENTISANAAARWKVGSLPTANKNVAFKISADTTVLVDATVTYGEVQVYGTGTLTFQSADGAAKMTIARKLQTTSTTAVQIDGGIEFGANAELEVVSTSYACMTAINCGTEAAPYEIPAITGAGIAYVAEGKHLMAAEINVGTFYALGNATVSDSAAIGTLQVQPTGVLTLDSANVSVSGTATIGGTVNVDATSTFIPTAVSDAGSVVWTGKQPDGSVWNTSADWTGTNVVINATGLTDMNPANWGNASSFIKLNGVAGYFVQANVEATAKKTILEDNGANAALQISNGYQGYSVTFRKIAGDGTIADTHNNATAWHMLVFKDATEFTGSIKATQASGCKKFVFSDAGTGTASASGLEGRLVVQSDGHAVIGAGKEWKPASSIHIAGEVKLLGAATMSKPVTINGTTAKLLLADSALTINNTLTFANGAKLTIDPGTIALSSTPATLITGLTNTEEPVVTGITVPGCTVSVGGTSGAYTIQATLGSGVWASGDGDWTETSFNGTEQSTDGSAVTFRASANDSVTVTLTGTRAPSTIAFNGGSATTYTLTGGTFSPSGTVTIESGEVVIDSEVTSGVEFSVAAGAKLTLSNATGVTVSGSGELCIAESGTVTLAAVGAIDGIASLSGKGTLKLPSNTTPSNSLEALLQNSNWEGTLVVAEVTANAQRDLHNWGNALSKIMLKGVQGYMPQNQTIQAEVVFENGSNGYAYDITDSWSSTTTFRKISGTGLIRDTTTGKTSVHPHVFRDASGFTGSIEKTANRRFFFSRTRETGFPATDGIIYIDTDGAAKIGDGNSWKATVGGIRIAGSVELLGAATMTGDTILENNASLKFDNISSGKMLVLNSTVTIAANATVNIAFGDGVVLGTEPGTKMQLISWGGAPEGDFEFADVTTPKCYRLEKRENGLYLVVKPGTIFSVY